MVSGKEQMRSSRMGDCFGRQESKKILEAASKGHDRPVLELKAKTESLYSGTMYSAAPRFRKAMAAKGKINHFVHILDNVGRVSSSLEAFISPYICDADADLFCSRLFRGSTLARPTKIGT